VNGSHLTDDVADVVVEAVELLNDLIGLAVRVVVAKGVSWIVEGYAVLWIAGSSRCNDLDVRISGLDCIVEQWEAVLAVRIPAARVASEPVLVTDFDVVQSEGFGVSEFSATLAPGRVGWAADKLDLIEGVIDKRL
jgi:hypothetical protein